MVADAHDVSDWAGAEALIRTALDEFGSVDRTIATMTAEEWDAVIRVHLRGTFAPTHFAAAYWRRKAKAGGDPVNARLINTSSPSGIYGNFGQANYAAAKAGIAALTVVAAEGWHLGPRITKDGSWTSGELDAAIPALLAEAAPPAGIDGETPVRAGAG